MKSKQWTPTLMATTLAALLHGPVMAQESSTTANAQPQQLSTVEVTGSRIKRAEVEGPAPVTMITAEQIRKEGFATVYDALASLTEFNGTVEDDAGWGQHTSNASPLNMRSMGPGRSLLLIDGHRAADYPLPYGGQSNFQNFSNIPAAAIERIEVLATGASAIYGSDAVAGVVNVVLKKDYVGNEFRIKGGTATRGGRDLFDLSWTGGVSGERWNLTYSLQYLKRDPVFAGQREFMDSENDAERPGWNEADRARGNRYNNHYDTARISRTDTGERVSPSAGACDNPGFGGVTSLQDYREYDTATHTLGPSLGQYCAADRNFHNWTVRDGQQSLSGYLHGRYDFTDTLEGWFSMSVFDSTGTSSIGDFALGYSPSVTWYDPQYDAVMEGKRYFTQREIGDALTRTKERSYDFSVGFKGTFAERFDWEASYNHAEYTLDKYYPAVVHSQINAYYLGPQLGLTADGVPIHRVDVNRFFTPIDGQVWNSISTTGHDAAESKTDQFQFVLSGELFQGWAGPVSFAAVAEAARQSYDLNPDRNTYSIEPTVAPPNEWDTPYKNPFYGYDLGGGSRDRWAVGTEFRVPLWDSQTPVLGSAAANLAVRYDNYSQTVDAAKVTWMSGLEWRPASNLLVRGSYATSFRAPDMHYVYAEGGESLVQRTDALRCIQNGDFNNCVPQNGNEDPATSNNYDMRSTRSGSPLLRYEEGESWTAGFVWDITNGLSLGVDYWNIELKDAIANVGLDEVLAAEAGCLTGRTVDGGTYLNPNTGQAPDATYCNMMTSRVHRDGPNGAITVVEEGPINKAGLRVSGVDLSSRYRMDTDRFGAFTFGLNYSLLLDVSQRDSEASEWSDGRSGARNGANDSQHTKLRASIGWQKDNWNATVFATRLYSARGAQFGSCLPFANGERGTLTGADTCTSLDASSVNYGQTTARNWDRIKAPVMVNLTAGYRLTDQMSVNLAINNLFDDVYKDPYKTDYVFTNERLWSPVGREVAVEYVFNFQ
jgi:outer membrane receptor protein involved in Fe transport